MQPVRILHCDDSESVRLLVSELLRPFAGINVIGQVDCHATAVTRAASLQPDLVLLDLDAKRDEEVVARLREVCSARIVVLSGDPDLDLDPLVMQADGWISKTTGVTKITRSILGAVADCHDQLVMA